MGAYRLIATKDDAEGQLDSGIGASDLTIVLGAGEGAEFPAAQSASATSGGSSTALNDTGIGALGLTVGDFIENITDGSHAFIVTINTNDIVTTVLQGGSGNTWDNNDVWAVDRFVVTLNKRDGSGNITTKEKALILSRSTDTLTVATGGRGFDGSTPAAFLTSDYCNLFSISDSIEGARDSLGEVAIDIKTLQDNKADTSTMTALLNARNWKDEVRVASTAAVTLATDFENGDTIDGIVLATGDRILAKDQASAIENGVYIVNASGAPTRATDFDAAAEITNAVVAVKEGTANADEIYQCTSDDPTPDTDNIVFVGIPSSTANFMQSTERKFVGDGSDGVQPDADLTITGSNNTVITKNFTSWTAGSVARTLTVTPTGCIVVIKISGDADFTNWDLDFAGKGMPGGAGGSGGGNGGDGGNGGNGGGVIIFQIGGNVTFSSTTASVAGINGVSGSTGSGGATGGGGGGGGIFVLLYNGTISGSLTPAVSGGSAGGGASGISQAGGIISSGNAGASATAGTLTWKTTPSAGGVGGSGSDNPSGGKGGGGGSGINGDGSNGYSTGGSGTGGDGGINSQHWSLTAVQPMKNIPILVGEGGSGGGEGGSYNNGSTGATGGDGGAGKAGLYLIEKNTTFL